jgi:hypothetical protein
MATTGSGFGQLSVTTSAAFNDTAQMYGAGFLEAALTRERIWSHSINALAWINSQFKGGVIPPNVVAFFATQDAWTRANIASNSSDHWVAMGSILAQFDGLAAGYAALAPANETLSIFQLQSMGAIGDYIDLIAALSPSDAPDFDAMTDAELVATMRKVNHCSALVKVTGDFSELFFAHVAWFIFQSTTRIFKRARAARALWRGARCARALTPTPPPPLLPTPVRVDSDYNLALHQPAVAGRAMSFSSYPAYLSSLDDWYAVWDSGIAVLETTNNVFNKSLYAAVVPQSLFAWHRVRLANLLAHDAPEWASVFAQYNSGT